MNLFRFIFELSGDDIGALKFFPRLTSLTLVLRDALTRSRATYCVTTRSST